MPAARRLKDLLAVLPVPIGVHRNHKAVGKSRITIETQESRQIRPRRVEVLAKCIDFKVAARFEEWQQRLQPGRVAIGPTSMWLRTIFLGSAPFSTNTACCSGAEAGPEWVAIGTPVAFCTRPAARKTFFSQICGVRLQGNLHDSCANGCSTDALNDFLVHQVFPWLSRPLLEDQAAGIFARR